MRQPMAATFGGHLRFEAEAVFFDIHGLDDLAAEHLVGQVSISVRLMFVGHVGHDCIGAFFTTLCQ